MMMTPLDESKPSISASSWFRVCSRSSWPPTNPVAPARDLPIASSSSMKMMHGALSFACSNRSRTRAAPTPTNISTNSEPESVKNGTSASPATARARSAFPVPGGPTRRTPCGDAGNSCDGEDADLEARCEQLAEPVPGAAGRGPQGLGLRDPPDLAVGDRDTLDLVGPQQLEELRDRQLHGPGRQEPGLEN